MPQWILDGFNALFDGFINGMVAIVAAFCIIMLVGIAIDVLERRKN